MFNELNNDQKSSGVDDIFAETDKLATPNGVSTIETKQAGLSSMGDKEVLNDEGVLMAPEYEDDNSSDGSGKILKIAIIVVVAAIVILGAYLVYVNFIAVDKETEITNEGNNSVVADGTGEETNVTQDEVPVVNTETVVDDDFIIPASENNNSLVTDITPETITPENVSQKIDSDSDLLSDYDEINIYNTNPNLIDTDFDGLNDYDETMVHKTDPLKSDTDGDGLSDYEEVKVHGTDPLKVDTDGDSYSDYDEILNGYNPLGDGLLPGYLK